MATIDELRRQSENVQLILKMQIVLIFVALIRKGQPAPEVPAGFCDAEGNFLPVPAGYLPVGHIDKSAGFELPREVSQQEAESHNLGGPSRVDTDNDKKSASWTAQETKRAVLELALGMDLSNVTRNANGEVVVDHPELPEDVEARVLVIGYDKKYRVAAGFILPRFQPKDFPTLAFKRDEVLSYQITGDCMVDDEVGTAVRHVLVSGPGAQEFRDKFGFAGEPQPWAATMDYVVTDRTTLAGGEVLEASTGGTSAAVEPAAPATVGDTVEDGTVTWTRVS